MIDMTDFLRRQGYSGVYVEIHKFGRDDSVGTSFTPVALGAVYKTPTPSATTRLRVKAGNVADTAAGAGARSIRVTYLDTSLRQWTEYLTTAGASPSAWTARPVFRLLTFRVHDSGTYASYPNFSHVGDIVLEDEALAEWGTISATGIPRGRSQIGVTCIPRTLENGAIVEAAYLVSFVVSTESNKTVDYLFYNRPDALIETPPYRAATIIDELDGANNQFEVADSVPRGPFYPGTDLGFLASASAAAKAMVNFEIIYALQA